MERAVKQRCLHRTTTLSEIDDRLPVVVRFSAGLRVVRLKTVDLPKGNGLGQKKQI